jgi:hypothetical protein
MKGLGKERGWLRWLDHSYRHIQKDLTVARESEFQSREQYANIISHGFDALYPARASFWIADNPGAT